MVDAETAIAADKAEAEDTTTLERAAQLTKDCAMLSAPACSTMARSRQQTRQDNHGRNSSNTLAQITDKT